jgi:hypothetical protein
VWRTPTAATVATRSGAVMVSPLLPFARDDR